MNVFTTMAAIGVGAALGANLRWALGLTLNYLLPQLPLGTLAANVLGAFLIGLAIALLAAAPVTMPAVFRPLVITGFLGALTTFSTFSAEIFNQLAEGRPLWAIAGIGAHVLMSLAAVALGVGLVGLARYGLSS
ncbi:fluoride efflux transporter CrcB [Salinisphaera sp. USBA-960]|uniref:fluoride efflux transporter CrcB n=1 Tax=Salinisphaera orenii TaxID=856731 RepID=UPI000DBE8BBC|nr:fluoride efflux transporter CrcB [Salifodinibacter halophilus]NNC27146.1 fluoride efflux transporter CrcB [Salifodinibacter halophilus]